MHQPRVVHTPWSVRAKGISEDEPWPELSPEIQAKYPIHKVIRINYRPVENSAGMDGDNQQRNLDKLEYPELGEKLLRSKNLVDFTDSPNYNPVVKGSLSTGAIPKQLKFSKREFRRAEKYCIDLKAVLKASMCIRKNAVKDITKFRSAVIKGNTDAMLKGILKKEELPIRKVKISISKSKKPSKLKRVILLDRDSKQNIHGQILEIERMEEDEKDVNLSDFNAMKISSDPELDVDYTRQMATMIVANPMYRNSKEENITEDTVSLKSDITDKLRELCIKKTQEVDDAGTAANPENSVNMEDVESTIVQKTEFLGINDDTKDEENVKPDGLPGLTYSRNFREYCTNMLTPGLNEHLEKFLAEIARLQRKLYNRDSNKGKYRRRYYAGLKEVRKHVETRKIKFVVIAPDLEKVQLEGGLDEQVYKLLESCRRQGTVFSFGLRRRKLGYYVHGRGFVGCVGITNYSSTEEIFKNVLMELVQARNEFRKLNGESEKTIDLTKLMPEDTLLSENINTLMKVLTSDN